MTLLSAADFDAGLDAYQARLAESAMDAADRSYQTAARPDAIPLEVTFGDLAPGDYMTNEGPNGRWVEVIEVRGPHCNVRSRHCRLGPDEVAVLFEIPESVAVSGETRYWIDRSRTEKVLVDARRQKSAL